MILRKNQKHFFGQKRKPDFLNVNFVEAAATKLLKRKTTPLYFKIKTQEEKDREEIDFSDAAEDQEIRKLTAIAAPIAALLKRNSKSTTKPELEEIPQLIKGYLTNPAHLEEYSPEALSDLVALGRLPNKNHW